MPRILHGPRPFALAPLCKDIGAGIPVLAVGPATEALSVHFSKTA